MADSKTGTPNPLAVRFDPDDLHWLRTRRTETGVSVNSEVKKAVAQYRRRVEAANRRKGDHGDDR
jgi:hypothetical protein